MKTIRIIFFASALFCAFPNFLQAHDIEGGEITWRCLPNGQYIFTMNFYSNCSVHFLSSSTTINYQNGQIQLKLDSNKYNAQGGGEISPKGVSGCQLTCHPYQFGGLQMISYFSNPIFLLGVPPSGGWVFKWEKCCRAQSLKNVSSPQALSLTLRSVMYPYQGKNANPCYDSSPRFAELPVRAFCANKEQIYNVNAIDDDFDSLVYSWDQSLDKIGVPLTYAPGFSYNNPLPDSSFHSSNNAAKLNRHTGEINFKARPVSTNYEFFAVTVRVDAYRKGSLIASVFREVPYFLSDCGMNNFPASSIDSVPYVGHIDTIYPGEFVNYTIAVEDLDYDSVNMRYQEIAMRPLGQLFSRDFMDSLNCLDSTFSPCATLSKTPVYNTLLEEEVLKDRKTVTVDFNWKTDCVHLGNETGKMYNFVFKTKDDACNLPATIYPSLSLYLSPIAAAIVRNMDTLSIETADSYQWFFNDSLIPNSDTNKIIATANGKYSVQIVKYNCPSLKSHYNMTTVSLDEEKMFSDVKIYPNPSAGKFTIEANNLHGSTKILVTDYQGREVQSFYLGQRYGFKREIDLSGFPKGIYLIQISNQLQVKSRKIVLY